MQHFSRARRSGIVFAVLALTICLLLLGARPAAAATYAPSGPTEILSAGGFHTCALQSSGAVNCWGSNSYSQADDQAGPYTQVSAGQFHTCALTPAGAVECWGQITFGQADDQVGPYTQVSAGFQHTCALTPAGAVECWGANNLNQANGQPGPYTQVSAGAYHTCALTPAGAVDCWGNNTYGQAVAQAGPYSQISAGTYHTCALTPAGAVECWGRNVEGQADGQPGPYTQVSAGELHTCALTPAGAIECWGRNDEGQATDQAGPYTQLSAGGFYTCALTPVGAVECWGDNRNGQAGNHAGPYGPYRPPMLPEIVSAGGYHTCALTPAGAADCWGDDFPDRAGPYTQLSTGHLHACALTTAGAVDCWGDNDEDQAGDQAGPYSQVSVGAYHNCALTPDGAVECWGFNASGQAEGQAGPYTQVSAGGYHTCGLTPAGAVDCWGRNDDGQAVDQPGPYTQISAGYSHTCGLTPAGAVDCWGSNDDGQATGQPGPYTQVSASAYHTCALTLAGAVDCWGRNDDGQAEDQPGPYTQVSAGVYHTCALTPGGAVECWGDNGSGQAADQPGPYGPYTPAGLTIVKEVSGVQAGYDWSFDFTGDLGAFSLTKTGPDESFSDLTPGDVAFSETAAAGYSASIACDNGDSSANGGISVSLDPGDDVTCTVTNTAAPATLVVRKVVSGAAAAGPWSFGYSGDLGPFTLSKAGPDTTFTGLDAGSYALSETAQAGFAVSASCDNGDATLNGDLSVALDPGQTVTCAFSNAAADVFVSTAGAGTTGDGLVFGGEDILRFDGDAWSKWFDGTDAGLTPNGKAAHNLNALYIPDPDGSAFLASFAQNARVVPGISGKVDGMDLVRWSGSAFSLYFDGQDVGLTVLTAEKIDALHVLDGSLAPPALAAAAGGSCLDYLLLSTEAAGAVPNYSGGTLKFSGEDVLGFCLTQSGATTKGKWTLVLDGSAQGMPKNALVNLSATADGQTLYLTTRATFDVDSATGGHSMIYRYDVATTTFDGPLFIAANAGLHQKLDALEVTGPLP